MNDKKQTFKYLIIDFFAASLAWILFNYFRKSIIESAVYGTNLSLRYSGTLIFSTLVISLFWLGIYYFSGYYYNIYKKSRLQEFSQTLVFSILGNLFLFFVLILDDVISGYKDYYYSFFTLLSLHFILTYLPRSILTSVTIKKIRKGEIGFNTLIIGSNDKALEIFKSYTIKNMWAGYRFIGFVNLNNEVNNELSEICPHLGPVADLEEIVLNEEIKEVIIAIELHEHKEIEGILRRLQLCQVSIKIIPDLFEILIGKTELALIEGIPLILVAPHLMPVWEKNLKNIIDKVFAIFFILIFSPLFLFTAIGVRFSSMGPVIYKQKRVGLHGKEFTIYKFRSMYLDAEKNGPELSNDFDSRVTKFGQIMRKTRLDEIPQFFNIIKGDMSLVGPRPERRFYIDQIVQKAPEYMLLLKTKPGITSLGQVKFGYAENVEEMIKRLKYDIVYIKNMSLYLDFKILIYTVLTVIKQNGK